MNSTQMDTGVSGELTTAVTPGLTDQMMTGPVEPSAGDSVAMYSHGERIFIGVMWLLISILGMTGNGMVILAVALSRKLQTPTNVFVVNLAVADFLSCFCLPWSVAGLFSQYGLPGAHAPCMISAFISFVSSGASLYHMASIALNRVLLIKRPMTLYQWLYTPAKIVFLVVLSWLVATCVILIPPLAGIGGLGYDEQEYTCTDQDTHPAAKLYQLIQVVFFFPVPMLMIIICYALVFTHVRSHFIAQRKRRPSTVPSKDAPSGPVSSTFIPSDCPQVQGPDTMDNQVHQRLNRQQIQITKNLLMIVVVYFVCIIPYSVMLFIGSDRYTLYGGTIFLCNTWINPIVYATKHPQFKVVLRMMLRCRCSRIPEPSRLVRRLSSKNVALNQVKA